jgi:hypothetical protein
MFVADGGVFTPLGQLSMGVQLFFCEICGGGMCCLSSTLNILMPMVSSRFVFLKYGWFLSILKDQVPSPRYCTLMTIYMPYLACR